MKEKIKEAGLFIQKRLKAQAKILLVLGSGLGALAEETEDSVIIPYNNIPHFPLSSAPGHKGQLRAGSLAGCNVIIMEGRFHYYEGHSMSDIAFPIRVLKSLGIENLLLTNAAGGVNLSFKPGDLMIINDHINLTGQNPLIGKNDSTIGPRFPDMTSLYNKGLSDKIIFAGKQTGLDLKTGVYAWMTGPSYETPAEIRMLRVLGADAIGMSTVPEAISARHAGMNVAGISCISNMAAGILNQPITEKEVFEITNRIKDKFSSLVRGFLALL